MSPTALAQSRKSLTSWEHAPEADGSQAQGKQRGGLEPAPRGKPARASGSGQAFQQFPAQTTQDNPSILFICTI